MAYFVNYPEKTNDWKSGKMIRQSTFRTALGSAPVAGETATANILYSVAICAASDARIAQSCNLGR